MNFFYKILTLPPYIKGKNFIVMFDVMFLLLISKDKKIVRASKIILLKIGAQILQFIVEIYLKLIKESIDIFPT